MEFAGGLKMKYRKEIRKKVQSLLFMFRSPALSARRSDRVRDG